MAVLSLAPLVLVVVVIFRLPDSESSSAQLGMRGIDALDVVLPRRFPPREWRSTGGMNPIDYWSWAIDPTFDAEDLQSVSLPDFPTGALEIQYQIVYENRSFEKEENRSKYLLVRLHGHTYAYDLPILFEGLSINSIFLLNASADELIFVGRETSDETIIFFYLINRPMADGDYEVIFESEEAWGGVIAQIGTNLNTEEASKICDGFESQLRSFLVSRLNYTC